MDSRGGRFDDPRVRHFGAGESYRPDRGPPPSAQFRRDEEVDRYIPVARPRSPPSRRRSRSPFRGPPPSDFDRLGGYSRDRSPQRYSRDRFSDEPPRSPPRRPNSADRHARYGGRRSPGPLSAGRVCSPDARSRGYEQEDQYRPYGGESQRGNSQYGEFDARRDIRNVPGPAPREQYLPRAPQSGPPRRGPPITPGRGLSGRSSDYQHDDGWGSQGGNYDHREPYNSAPRGGNSYPPGSTPVSTSAHNRPYSNGPYTPSSLPRGGPGMGPRGGPLPYHNQSNGPPRRGNFGHQSFQGPPHHQQLQGYPPNGPPVMEHSQSYDRPGPPRGVPPFQPHSPQNGHAHHPPHPPHPHAQYPPNPHIPHQPPPRMGAAANSTSKTYPLTQRFNLSTSIVPGGKLAPPSNTISAENRARLKKLEEESERLRKELEEKQEKKRIGMREWETARREAGIEGLKAELAQGSLEELVGGGDDAF